MSEEGQDAQAPDVEERAREVGWVPKEEWKGKPDYWKPAEEWLERAPKTYIPKLEKQIGKLEGQLAKQEADFAGRIQRLEATTSRRLKQEQERLEREYENRILDATKMGDTEGVKKALSDQKQAMEKLDDKIEKAEDKQGDKKAPEVPPELEEWAAENTWFVTPDNPRGNKKLTAYAVAEWDDIEDEMPRASMKAKLGELSKRMADEFPSKFGKDDGDDDEPQRRGSRVEGGSRNTNGSGSKRQGWSDIPSGDREVAKSMIGDGKLFKDQADYAKAYWTEDAA